MEIHKHVLRAMVGTPSLLLQLLHNGMYRLWTTGAEHTNINIILEPWLIMKKPSTQHNNKTYSFIFQIIG